MQTTAIVIPCYNEAARLPTRDLDAYLDTHLHVRLLLVDDGSTDTTLEVLTSLATRHPRSVTVLRSDRNGGKAEAVRRGMLAALDGGAEFVGYWDADLATPLRYVDVFLDQLNRSDALLVFGSRVRLMGRHIERQAVRHYVGRAFATIAGLALGAPIYDTQCGAKLFRATPELRDLFEKPFDLGWTFDVELFARLLASTQRGRKVDASRDLVEWPLEEWHDAPGSKLRPAHFARIAWETARLFAISRHARR